MTYDIWVPGKMWTINAERRWHYHKRAQHVEPVRTAAKLITQTMMRENGWSLIDTPVHVRFHPVQQMKGTLADTANHLPPCKAALDGIVEAGLLHDDNPEWVYEEAFVPVTKSRNPGVRVVITPIS